MQAAQVMLDIARRGAARSDSRLAALRELRAALVHQLQREANGHRRNHDADEKRKSLRCGVAPTRYPVFKSCEVSPASAEAMQTTPPMVMARAPNAGAVQPLTRKIAEVAISVAIVMPEMGFAELPISPTIRELTVTNRNPKTTMSSGRGQVGPQAHLRSRNRLEDQEEKHQTRSAEWSRP